jgi:hypothetical protein
MVGIQMCIDFRKVNLVTEDDPFPLPRIEDLIEHLSLAKYITNLDLRIGYYQVPLDNSKKGPTKAYITHNGKYEFTCLPFGTRTARGHFQWYKNIVRK